MQHGPFWHIEPQTQDTLSEDELGGYANSASPTRLNKVVPVEVAYGEESDSMFMPVQRARRLLRAYETGYVYNLSDVAARAGRIQWDLELANQMCMYWSGLRGSASSVCGHTNIADTVNIFGVQMPGCPHHIRSIRTTAQNLRLERSKV